MANLPYVADRAAWDDATQLMMRFGDDARFEAGQRADRNRDIGNVSGFCRWRQIARLIAHLADNGAGAMLH